MRWIKNILIIFILGIVSYLVFWGIFKIIKVSGYSYLFRAKVPYDMVIKHASIIDGTGENARFRGDIAVRDGHVVGIGFVNPGDSPVFDAGGLTVVPAIIEINESTNLPSHLFRTSFPRYKPEQIYFIEPPHAGLNLTQAACKQEVTVEELFKILEKEQGNAKVLLFPDITEKTARLKRDSCEELIYHLTGLRSDILGFEKEGSIKEGNWASFYFFKTKDYNDESLRTLLFRGESPQPELTMDKGIFLNQ